MFRKIQRLVSNIQPNKLAKLLIVVGLVMFCLTPAEASISKTISYSASITNNLFLIPPNYGPILIDVSNSASGTITITGPGGFSEAEGVSSLGLSSFDVILGAAGTYTVNESYNLMVTGSNAFLGTIPAPPVPGSATPWTFTSSTPGATASFQVSSDISDLAVTSTSANIETSVSGMTIAITTLVPIPIGDSISITAEALWTVDTSVNVTETVATVAVITNHASATFDLTGPAGRSGSGTFKAWTDMPAGSYTCTFNPVVDFNTPAPQTKTLAAGGSITFDGVYTPIPQIGTVAVTTNNASATFDLTGPANRSGAFGNWTDMPVGSYTCTFNPVAGFNTPAPQTKDLVAGGAIIFVGVYTPQTGTVEVTTDNASATFDLTGPAGRNGSGISETWTDMPVGSYTCTFNAVAGFNTPVPQTKPLADGETITFDGVYIPQTGTVEVTTNNASATFDLTGPADRNGSGTSETWTDMPMGSYTCTFSPIVGFNTPAPQTKPLPAGGTITFDGVYTTAPWTIALEKDWNLISIPVELTDTSREVVLQPIDGLYRSVWAYDPIDGWERYVVNGLPFLNNLTDIAPSKGYWVDMSEAADLVLNGAPAEDSIPLIEDWNLVGFNRLIELGLLPGISSIVDCIDSVWGYDPVSGWERHVVDGLSYLNTMVAFKPGRGYWIDVKADCWWDVSGVAAAPPSPSVVAGSRQNYIIPTRPGIPYTVWGTVEINGVQVSDMSTVVLKVDNKEQLSREVKTIKGYEGHGGIYRLDIQPTVGSYGQAELYVKFNGMEIKAASIPPGTSGQTINLNLSVQMLPTASLLRQNYPNPFNPETWIPYQLRADAHVEIKIYTGTGQLARTLSLGHKPAGFYAGKERAAHWDGRNEAGEHVASGVYFYSIKADDLSATRKMVVRQ